MVRVIVSYPPLYGEIDAKFKISGKPVIFAWSPYIYNPGHLDIPRELLLHEQVHIDRQGDDPEGWWRKYIADDKFRLEEEILAHRAEYQELLRANRGDRNTRRRILAHVALKLCSPIYGQMVQLHEAKKLLAA